MKIEKQCPHCKHYHFVIVQDVDYQRWQSGTLVQDAFPNLNADEREILMTGICGPCWEKIFGNEDDDDFDE